MNCPHCGRRISSKRIAREIGSRGGKKGGRTLMQKFTPEELSERNRQIALKRWHHAETNPAN